MRWRVVLFALTTVFVLLSAAILIMRNPAPPPVEDSISSSDWLNNDVSENLSAFLVPRNKTDFDWENMSDGQTWRIGDQWVYDGRLDATAVIDDAGVEGARIDEVLRGNATMEVVNITVMDWEGVGTLTYELRFSGSFDGPAIFPVPLIETLAGVLQVGYDATEYVRADDHATLQMIEHLTIDFEYDTGIVTGTEPIADIHITTNNSPAIEWWDFPIGLNETWLSEVEESKSYSGESNYVALPEEDEVEDVFRRFVALEQGKGLEVYSGCDNATNVTAFDKNNKVDGWRWYCTEIGTWSWRVGEVPLGVTGDFRLLEYTPAAVRSNEVELTLELSPPATNKSSIIEVWINASHEEVNTSGLSGELTFGCCTSIPFQTDANGTTVIKLNVSNQIDDTSTFDDLASHGILAKIDDSDQMAMATVTIYGSLLGESVRNTGGQWQWDPLTLGVHNAAVISSAIRW